MNKHVLRSLCLLCVSITVSLFPRSETQIDTGTIGNKDLTSVFRCSTIQKEILRVELLLPQKAKLNWMVPFILQHLV